MKAKVLQIWVPLLAALMVVAVTGCVQRRLVVRSQPAGAVVYVDNVEIGKTPTAVNFTYYGTRRIRLVRDGFETIVDFVRIQPPFYEYPGLEFVSENLVPFTIQDRRLLTYTLRPKRMVPTEQLIRRAEQLRRNSGGGPPVAGGPVGSRLGGSPVGFPLSPEVTAVEPPAFPEGMRFGTPAEPTPIPPGVAYYRDAAGNVSYR